MIKLCPICDEDISMKKNSPETCSRSCSNRLRAIRNNPSFREDYFAEPNLENSYWAGFIAADGSIATTQRGQKRLVVNLSSKDKDHLEKLRNTLGSGSLKEYKYERSFGKSSKVYSSAIYTKPSDKMCNDLALHFNVHPRKSLHHQPPELEGQLAYAFIAGYIDGDGCYYAQNGYPVIKILGTFEFLLWIRQVYELETLPKLVSGSKIYYTFISGNSALLVKESFKDLNLPLLERKLRRWSELGVVEDK